MVRVKLLYTRMLAVLGSRLSDGGLHGGCCTAAMLRESVWRGAVVEAIGLALLDRGSLQGMDETLAVWSRQSLVAEQKRRRIERMAHE